jgi:hypothetical protein
MKHKLNRILTFLVLSGFHQIAVSAEPVTLVCNGETIFSVPALGPVTPKNDPFTVNIDFDKGRVFAPIMFPTCNRNFEQFEKCRCDIEAETISCQGAAISKRDHKVLWRFNFSLNRSTGLFLGENLHSTTGSESNYQHTEIWKYMCDVAKRKF